MQQQHVARLNHDVVGRHDLFEHLTVDAAPLVAEVVGEVDQHAAALHAVERHVFETEVVRERPVPAAVAAGVVARADEVGAGAVAVVIDTLLNAVAVGVELGADVRERVPLRRVLQRQRDHVVGPHVDVLGVAEVRHLAHVHVVEDARLAVHVLGRRQLRWVPPLVQRGAAGEVEREAQAEADAGLDLGHTLQHLLAIDEIDAAQFVVVAPVAPGRSVGALRPALRHGPQHCRHTREMREWRFHSARREQHG